MKPVARTIEQIWDDKFMRDLYFGGVLFTELLRECREVGTNVPLWLSGGPQGNV